MNIYVIIVTVILANCLETIEVIIMFEYESERTALVIGKESVDKLSQKRVAVFGVGGVGGGAARAAADPFRTVS